MNSPLIKLSIEHLRGGTVPFPLHFEPGKKLMVIYGENGTGKSTICDSMEFIGNGKIGSLENRGLGRTETFWASQGKKPTDVRVTLEATGGTCMGKMGKGGVVISPEELRPRVEVLRRAQILSLVEARPAERYSAIQRFIDVTGPEASEASLRKLIDSMADTQKIAIARLSENESMIEQAWAIDGSPGDDAFTWAESQSQSDTKLFATEAKRIESLIQSYARLRDSFEAIKPNRERSTLAQKALAEAKAKRDLALESVAGSEEIPLLESAKTYFQKYPHPAKCPLCESGEHASELGDRVLSRLQNYAALREIQRSVKTAESALETAELKYRTTVETVTQLSEDFEKILNRFDWPTDIAPLAASIPANLAELGEWLSKIDLKLPKWKEAKEKRTDRQRFVATITASLKTYQHNFREQKELDILLPELREAVKIMERERRTFTDEILSRISIRVGELYEKVHPTEGLSKVTLELDSKKKASLEMAVGGIPPQAYFSESHLDTLGLCVFLALAELDNPDETILVLDDILASVDEVHAERLLEMLRIVAQKFRHCILTTHYRPWKDKLRNGVLTRDGCQFVELAKWSADGGVKIVS